MQVRDRIREFRRIPAGELRPSPRNWRLHPEEQANALRGILAEIGIGDVCIVFVNEAGEFELIDGHLRAETLPNQLIPCIVLDVNRDEAYQLVALIDSLGRSSRPDVNVLSELLPCIKFESPDVTALLDQFAVDVGVKAPTFAPASTAEQGRLDRKGKYRCPECGHEW